MSLGMRQGRKVPSSTQPMRIVPRGQQFVGPPRLLRDLEAGLAEVDDGDADVDDSRRGAPGDDSAPRSR